jgi:hypothetical protein
VTPAEHLATAERVLSEITAEDIQDAPAETAVWVQVARAHIGLAIAVELGAPHAAAVPEVPDGH